MKKHSLQIMIILFFSFSLLGSCTKEEELPSTDIVELKEMMNISFNPVAVLWSFEKSNDRMIALGPTDYDVTAVLTLSQEDYNRIKKEYSGKEGTTQLLTLDSAEKWFPESVKKCFKNRVDHYEVQETYDAEVFTKGSLVYGYFLFTDDNKILVHLFTN